MKRDFRPEALGVKLLCVGLFVAASTALALTENPYGGIVGRNAFALKPPTPPPVATAPVIAPPGIELQGLTTILGRPQVLLKIKLPPKPPEGARDQSVVLDVGQREGDVEVLAINIIEGTVQLKNQGNDLALSMKDNAAKPAAGPALTSPVAPQLPGAIPPPVAAPGAGRQSVTGMGGVPTLPTMPTRSLRAGGNAMNGVSGGGVAPGGQQAAPVSAEQAVALMEIERERTKELVKQGKYPPFPPPLPGISSPPTPPE